MFDSSVIQSPFERLRSLLGDHEPGQSVIDLTIGEPQHDMPDFVMSRLDEASKLFGRYPPIRGTAELRSSIADWHVRRYAVELDPETQIIVLNGSREGLYSVIQPCMARRSDIRDPAVLMPNPFYQCYVGGAISAGAEPVFLNATPQSDFLPDLDALANDDALLRRCVAFYICSPSNPQGAIASSAYLSRAIKLARRYDFILLADECYSEIYFADAPPGALQVAHGLGGDARNVVTFNSLSKRSNLPGLRSGFCAGDENFIDEFSKLRNVVAPQVPLPVQHASAAIWADEAHVSASRALYAAKMRVCDEILGDRFGYLRPGGAFFLWLNMEQFDGGEAATVTLWKRCGVKVLPGAFLTSEVYGQRDPGKDYVRVALVHDLETTQTALERIISL